MRSGSLTEAKRHKIKDRERPYQEFYFKGKQVCRKAFCFIHNIEKKSAVNCQITRQEWPFTRGSSPRFLCRPTTFFLFARAVGRQRALHKENSRFASPTLGRHISTFCGYRILFSIRNPYINCFTNHFSFYS